MKNGVCGGGGEGMWSLYNFTKKNTWWKCCWIVSQNSTPTSFCCVSKHVFLTFYSGAHTWWVLTTDWTSMHTAQVKSAALALPQSSLSISKLLPLPCSPGVCFLLHNIWDILWTEPDKCLDLLYRKIASQIWSVGYCLSSPILDCHIIFLFCLLFVQGWTVSPTEDGLKP